MYSRKDSSLTSASLHSLQASSLVQFQMIVCRHLSPPRFRYHACQKHHTVWNKVMVHQHNIVCNDSVGEISNRSHAWLHLRENESYGLPFDTSYCVQRPKILEKVDWAVCFGNRDLKCVCSCKTSIGQWRPFNAWLMSHQTFVLIVFESDTAWISNASTLKWETPLWILYLQYMLLSVRAIAFQNLLPRPTTCSPFPLQGLCSRR